MNLVVELLVLLASLEYLTISGWKYWVVILAYAIIKIAGQIIVLSIQTMMKKTMEELKKQMELYNENKNI